MERVKPKKEKEKENSNENQKGRYSILQRKRARISSAHTVQDHSDNISWKIICKFLLRLFLCTYCISLMFLTSQQHNFEMTAWST